jgi:L-alanine-DL-glutamate epimerase and related enzymes of enolase superfamily
MHKPLDDVRVNPPAVADGCIAKAGMRHHELRIVSCRTQVVTRKMPNAPWNPRTKWSEKNVVLVILEADGGHVGIGEAYCDGGSPMSVQAIIERDFAPFVVGHSALAIAQAWHRMVETTMVSTKGGAAYAAISAIDIALWDIAGKVLGAPVWRLLGGRSNKVFAYASGGLYGRDKTLPDLAEEMSGYVAKGFKAVKIKVAGASLREDTARVAAVREAIGPDVLLMIDALYALSVSEAIRMSRAVERYDIHFLEAPVSRLDIEGLARVARESSIPVAGNEFAHGIDEFRQLLAHDAVSIVHLDAILCGGISEAQRISALAQAFHRPVSFHAASSAVCFSANLHVAAAVGNAHSIEYHMIHQLLFDRLPAGTFAIEDGHVVLPEAPGLGFDAERLLPPE